MYSAFKAIIYAFGKNNEKEALGKISVTVDSDMLNVTIKEYLKNRLSDKMANLSAKIITDIIQNQSEKLIKKQDE